MDQAQWSMNWISMETAASDALSSGSPFPAQDRRAERFESLHGRENGIEMIALIR